jgi:hypothetical protein
MPFSASRAFSEAFDILKSRFGVLIGTALIFWVGLIAIMAVFGGTLMAGVMASAAAGTDPDPAQMFAGMGFSIVLFYLLIYAVQFAMALAMMRLCSDRHPPSIGDAIGSGVRGVPTMFGVVIILAIAGIVVGLVFGLIFGAITAALNSGALSVVLALAGFVLALYVYARLSMLTPVIAIDGERNPIRVISRSWEMTGQAAFKIVLVIGLAAVVAIVAILVLVGATIGTAALTGQPPSPGGIIAFVIGMIAFAVTVGLYFYALIAAIHRQVSGGGAAQASAAFE